MYMNKVGYTYTLNILLGDDNIVYILRQYEQLGI